MCRETPPTQRMFYMQIYATPPQQRGHFCTHNAWPTNAQHKAKNSNAQIELFNAFRPRVPKGMVSVTGSIYSAPVGAQFKHFLLFINAKQ